MAKLVLPMWLSVITASFFTANFNPKFNISLLPKLVIQRLQTVHFAKRLSYATFAALKQADLFIVQPADFKNSLN